MSKTIYKIQNRNGEFATADGWSKQGKYWKHLAHVKRHLSEHHGTDKKYANADLVSFELVETTRTPMYHLINEAWEEEKQREHNRQVILKKCQVEYAKRQLAEAQQKLKELGA
jgi:hypothetical protein